MLALFLVPPGIRGGLDRPRVKSWPSHFLTGIPQGLDVRLSYSCKMWAIILAFLYSIINA